MEALYGSASPMWASVPSAGFAFKHPVSVGNGPIAAPTFRRVTDRRRSRAARRRAFSNVPPVSRRRTPTGTAPNLVTFAPQGPAGLTASSLLMAIALRRGQPQGPANDQEVEEFIYDALELLPGAADVEVRCEGGRVTLTGSVPHKRVKHDVGEIAWAIPALHDVQNNVTIASRRRARASDRDTESPQSEPAGSRRKRELDREEAPSSGRRRHRRVYAFGRPTAA